MAYYPSRCRKRAEDPITVGVINVFLGGTGKFVAEELKGLSTHYDLELPAFIAFDLSHEDTHTGIFALGSDLLAPHKSFQDTVSGVTVPTWANMDAGKGLAPSPHRPGPRQRPEVAVMSQIARQMRDIPALADGLWGLRASGLPAFAAFMSPDLKGGEADASTQFKRRVRAALNAAGPGGQPITVNIVASTAGGTGAGFFLPLALWLRQTPVPSSLTINLVLVVSSAFDNEPLDAGSSLLAMQSKGRTGTFAIIRELDLLQRADQQTTFAERRFPIHTGNTADLTYQLGERLFNRVYWVGRRDADVAARKEDVYAETDPLVRILGDVEAANNLDARTGDEAQRLLPSVVTIDYPRLDYARRESSRLIEQAMQRLIDGGQAPDFDHDFFAYPGNNPGAFGKFLKDNKSLLSANEIDAMPKAEPRNVDDLVGSFTDEHNFEQIPKGVALQPAGYNANADQWTAYCEAMSSNLEQRRQRITERIDQVVRDRVLEEVESYRKYVVRVSKKHLAHEGGPFSLDSLGRTIEKHDDGRRRVEKFFGEGLSAMLPGNLKSRKYSSPEGVREQIKAQSREMQKPRAATTDGGLSLGRWVVTVLVAAVFGVIAWALIGTAGNPIPGNPLPRFLGTVGIIILVAAVMFNLLKGKGKGKSTGELRRGSEADLIRRYEDWIFAYAGFALLKEIKESFVPSAQKAVRQLEERADELRTVYEELQESAHAVAIGEYRPPLHSIGQVGIDPAGLDVYTSQLMDALVRSIRVMPRSTGNSLITDLRIEVKSHDGGAPITGNVRELAATIEAKKAAKDLYGAATLGELNFSSINQAIDRRSTTALAHYLPLTFAEALRKDAGDGHLELLDEHLAALVHMSPAGEGLRGQDRRNSSVDCRKTNANLQRLYVPSSEVQGLVARCMQGQGGLLREPVIRALRDCMGPGGTPIVVPALGASIALLSLWAPDESTFGWSPTSIMDTDEGHRAHDTYYGATPAAKESGSTRQSVRNFHILPELSAAAAIECAVATPEPLVPSVTARLLGSHPDSQGPTLLELFYLLRTDETITSSTDRDPVDPLQTWSIQHGGQSIRLIRQSVLDSSAQNDVFGGGRGFVNAFDAFQDFMLYDGVPGGLQKNLGKFAVSVGAEAMSKEWEDVAELARMQTSLVQRWGTFDRRRSADDEYAAMRALLRDDVDEMGRAKAARDWLRAVDFVLAAGHQRRLRLAAAHA